MCAIISLLLSRVDFQPEDYYLYFMFSYPEIDRHMPIAEQRKFALTRRVDKLMVWLQRPEYAVYENDESTVKLVKLIYLIIYALEMSLPDKEWNSIRRKLIKVRNTLTGLPEDEEQDFEPDERVNYQNAHAALLKILVVYKSVLLKAYLT